MLTTSRRSFVTSVVAAAGGVLLAACGQAATPTPAPAKPAEPAKPADTAATAPVPAAAPAKAGTAQTEIIYWASWTGLFEEMVKRIANAFMAKNPDVKVNHLVIPAAEMDAKILT